MVHQHFMLVPVFTVAENVALGHEPTSRGGPLDLDAARRAGARAVRRASASTWTPTRCIEDLPVGVQQRVEIIKALARDAKVLILDEPTAVLTPQETDELIGIMRQLAAAGTSIVFITHKLREVRAVADRITVIRRGKVVGSAEPSAEPSRARRDDGRPRRQLGVDKAPAQPGEVALTVRDLTCWTTPGRGVVDGVSFDVARGEILAVAGVQGNGQTELAEAILGLQPPAAGPSCSTATSSSGSPSARSSTPASASCPRTARTTGWSASSPSPRTSSWT